MLRLQKRLGTAKPSWGAGGCGPACESVTALTATERMHNGEGPASSAPWKPQGYLPGYQMLAIQSTPLPNFDC